MIRDTGQVSVILVCVRTKDVRVVEGLEDAVLARTLMSRSLYLLRRGRLGLCNNIVSGSYILEHG